MGGLSVGEQGSGGGEVRACCGHDGGEMEAGAGPCPEIDGAPMRRRLGQSRALVVGQLKWGDRVLDWE